MSQKIGLHLLCRKYIFWKHFGTLINLVIFVGWKFSLDLIWNSSNKSEFFGGTSIIILIELICLSYNRADCTGTLPTILRSVFILQFIFYILLNTWAYEHKGVYRASQIKKLHQKISSNIMEALILSDFSINQI